MGCSSSREEPPRQQPTKKKPTPAQDANPHPSIQQKPGQGKSSPLTKESLARYVELEKLIHQKEGKNIVKAAKSKEEQLKAQEEHIKTLEANYQSCQEAVKKEKADVDMLTEGGVGDFIANNESLAKEKEEYVEALNNQEIAKKELDEGIRQRDLMVADHQRLKQSADEVQNLMDEQEDLLAGIFGGAYGSELENKLEGELDLALEKKRRISIAKTRWQNGRVLIQYAVNQLGFAVKKWTALLDAPPTDTKMRYTLATEARNNLVAANQNITSAQRYLHTITFPYCKRAEMDTLHRATSNIYTDMQTSERHSHAHNVYNVTYKRAGALLQWFDHVIKTTIVKDFAAAKAEAATYEKDLQKERIRLIQERAKAELGETVDIKSSDQMSADDDEDDGPDKELLALATKTGEEGEENNTTDNTKSDANQGTTPLPDDELAPAPSNNDLFGDIDDLKRQHEKDMEEFQKQQELNKTRLDQGLQEKLARRRSRKKKSEKA